MTQKKPDTSFYSGQKSTRVVNRLYELDGKKKEKIAALQYQKYKDELSGLQSKPEISLTSKLIAQYKVNKPINKRVKEVLDRKEENLRKLTEEVQENKKAKEPELTFKPDINRKGEKTRTSKEFTNQIYAWQLRKTETIQREQYDNLTKELEELTFKPVINEKSKRIISYKVIFIN